MLNDNKVFQALENIMFSRAVLQIREKEAEKITIMNDTGNKQKILRLLEITAGAFGLFVAFGWSFFDNACSLQRKKTTEEKEMVSTVSYKEKIIQETNTKRNMKKENCGVLSSR